LKLTVIFSRKSPSLTVEPEEKAGTNLELQVHQAVPVNLKSGFNVEKNIRKGDLS
jgi:hypothetical protein